MPRSSCSRTRTGYGGSWPARWLNATGTSLNATPRCCLPWRSPPGKGPDGPTTPGQPPSGWGHSAGRQSPAGTPEAVDGLLEGSWDVLVNLSSSTRKKRAPGRGHPRRRDGLSPAPSCIRRCNHRQLVSLLTRLPAFIVAMARGGGARQEKPGWNRPGLRCVAATAVTLRTGPGSYPDGRRRARAP